jgi:Ca2+-binding EF-hand superfamily protein
MTKFTTPAGVRPELKNQGLEDALGALRTKVVAEIEDAFAQALRHMQLLLITTPEDETTVAQSTTLAGFGFLPGMLNQDNMTPLSMTQEEAVKSGKTDDANKTTLRCFVRPTEDNMTPLSMTQEEAVKAGKTDGASKPTLRSVADSWLDVPTVAFDSTDDEAIDADGRSHVGSKPIQATMTDKVTKEATAKRVKFSAAGEEIEDDDIVKAMYRKIDVDESGDISKAEILRAFKTDDIVINFCKSHVVLAPLLDPKTFRNTFDSIDSDNNAAISLEEFRQAIQRMTDALKPEEPNTFCGRASQMQARGAFVDATKDIFNSGALDQEIYAVENFYWDTGLCQGVARADVFQNLTLGVIVANAIYIGVDADNNKAEKLFEAEVGFIVCEFLFFIYFGFEWVMRFGAFKHKTNCLKDSWFKFDSFLMALMVVEMAVVPVVFSDTAAPPTGPLRLLRLLRLSRMVRLMRSFPELATMVKAIAAALRAVFSSFIMVIILVYIFAIIMFIFLKDDAVTHTQFSTLGRCMWTLLLDGVLGDSTGTVLNLLIHRQEANTILSVIVFFIFMILATVTVMNMVIGVLCEVVASVTEAEKEEGAHNLMKETILVELKKFDDGDGLISEDELGDLMTNKMAVQCLQALGVNVDFLQTLQVKAFEIPGSTISIPDLLEQMLMCREDGIITMKHSILLQEITTWVVSNKIRQLEGRMNKKLDARFGMLLDELETFHRKLLHRLGGSKMQAGMARTGFAPPQKLFPSAPESRPTSALSFASWI